MSAFTPSVPILSIRSNQQCSSFLTCNPSSNPITKQFNCQPGHSRLPYRRPRSHSLKICVSAVSDRILWADNITKTFDGTIYQFRDISLNLTQGSKIAILGANGCGKSTLLSVLAGLINPDNGSVSLRRGADLALVTQELPFDLDPSLTVLSAVRLLAAQHTSKPAVRTALAYATAVAAVEQNIDDESNQKALTDLSKMAAQMERFPDAWQVESYLSTALTKLDLPSNTQIGKLSGGQKRRVGIAAALVSRPDVLLLDEVTNHLSIEGIQFLEDILQDPSLTVLCISHDRYFVNQVCTSAIWELDEKLHHYPPGYDQFLTLKTKRFEQEEKETADLAKAFKKELEWMRRQPKARSSKSKSRIDEVNRMEQELRERKQKLKSSTQVQSLKSTTTRLGTEVVKLENITISRGKRILIKDFNYTFQRGERVGICGGNGVGKSSLLRTIMGQLEPESGSIDVGETVRFGYFDQEGIDLATPLSEASALIMEGKSMDEIRVIDYVSDMLSLYGVETNSQPNMATKSVGDRKSRDEAEEAMAAQLDIKIANLSNSVSIDFTERNRVSNNPLAKMSPIRILDHFGFNRTKQYNFVGHLSGGEKRRLQLMRLLLKNPNFLLLDEVSNDLDVNTLTMLEELLLDYTGVLILCSHDRFMLDRLVDHLLIIEGNGEVSLIEGKFTDYLDAKKELENEEKKLKKQVATESDKLRKAQMKTTQSRKLSYKEKREYERLEKEIEVCQQKHEELTNKLESEAVSAAYGDLAEWTEQLAQLEQEIELKSDRWLQLAEICGE